VSGAVLSGLWIEIQVSGLCSQGCGLRSRCLGLWIEIQVSGTVHSGLLIEIQVFGTAQSGYVD